MLMISAISPFTGIIAYPEKVGDSGASNDGRIPNGGGKSSPGLAAADPAISAGVWT